MSDYAGQLHPAVIERAGLPKGHLRGGTGAGRHPDRRHVAAPVVSPFPAVFQDLSLVVDADVPAQAVIDAVRVGADGVLENVELFDVYTGRRSGTAASR